jgi:hypothetical protein
VGALARLATSRRLALGVSVVALSGGLMALASAPAEAAAVSPVLSFADASGDTPMGVAFDGTHYWSVSGGGTGGVREAEYDVTGALVATFSPGIDFRSISIDSSGRIFARGFNSPTIYQQTSPGVFTTFATLSGASIHYQGSLVVVNQAGDGFLSMNQGVVEEWDMSGSHTGSVTLNGYGANGEGTSYIDGVRIAEVDGYFLTFNESTAEVSRWDSSGNRVSTLALTGAPTADFNAAYSFSATDGHVFLDYDGQWHQFPLYAITTTPSGPVAAGGTVSDQARIVGGQSPTGTVTFALYPPADASCTGTPIATSSATLSGGSASSHDVAVTLAGTYHWTASYSGDSDNAALTSSCADEAVTVTPAALDHLRLSPANAHIANGASQTYTAEGFDTYGNSRGDQTGVTYTIDGAGTCTADSCTGPAGQYAITGTKAGATGSATLTVAANAPTVTTQPADTTAVTGDDATFTAAADGDPSPSVQWQSSTDGTSWSDVSGANHATLTVHLVNPGQDGARYRAVFANSAGTATSDPATLTVSPVTLTVTDSAGGIQQAGATLTAGRHYQVTLRGVLPGSHYTIQIHSTPVTVGSMTADASGTASAGFVPPASLATGPHTLSVLDQNGVAVVTYQFALQAEPTAAAGLLPFTGANIALGTGLALALGAAGLTLLVAARRRHP